MLQYIITFAPKALNRNSNDEWSVAMMQKRDVLHAS